MKQKEKFSEEDLISMLPTNLVESNELTLKQKLVLGQLLIYNGLDVVKTNGYFYRSNKDLCADCGIQEKTLIAALRKLESFGYIKRKSGDRKSGASEYCIDENLIFNYCNTSKQNYSNDYSNVCSNQIAEMSFKIRELEELVINLEKKIAVIEARDYCNTAKQNYSNNYSNDYSNNYSNDYSNQIAEMSFKIRKLEELVINLEKKITVIEAMDYCNTSNENYSNNYSTDTETDTETESESDKEKFKKEKNTKKKNVEETVEESVVEDSINFEKNEQTSNKEECYQTVLAKIKPVLKLFNSDNTLQDLKYHCNVACAMAKSNSTSGEVLKKVFQTIDKTFQVNLLRISN